MQCHWRSFDSGRSIYCHLGAPRRRAVHVVITSSTTKYTCLFRSRDTDNHWSFTAGAKSQRTSQFHKPCLACAHLSSLSVRFTASYKICCCCFSKSNISAFMNQAGRLIKWGWWFGCTKSTIHLASTCPWCQQQLNLDDIWCQHCHIQHHR